MRKIKFRGRDMFGKWHYGALLPIANIAVIYTGSQSDFSKIPDCELSNEDVAIELMNNEVEITDPRTIGQYTGLKDKNGVDIYEGDIIGLEDETRLIDFKNGSFGWLDTTTQQFYSLTPELLCRYWRVVGNIHDNPELLTNKTE